MAPNHLMRAVPESPSPMSVSSEASGLPSDHFTLPGFAYGTRGSCQVDQEMPCQRLAASGHPKLSLESALEAYINSG